ncbi:hypothetical protein OSTOST_16237, partial [Ostertagia ostertagi]
SLPLGLQPSFSSRRRRRAEQRSEDFRRLPFVADDEVEEDEFLSVAQPINTTDDGKKVSKHLIAFKHQDSSLHLLVLGRFPTTSNGIEQSSIRTRLIAYPINHQPSALLSTTQRQLVMEILGRCEPEIARRQGIRVGLYSDEKEDIDDRFNRLYVGDK